MMELNEEESRIQDNRTADSGSSRRNKTHLNFSVSHEARHASRRQGNTGDAGVDDLNDKPKEESAAIFTQAFNAEHADISESLAKLLAERGQTPADTGISGVRHAASAASFTASSGSDMGTVLDTLVDRVKELRQRTAEATIFLPPYDVRRALEEIGKLWASVESTRAELAPRRKFSFRSRRITTGGATSNEGAVLGSSTTTGSEDNGADQKLSSEVDLGPGKTPEAEPLGLQGVTEAKLKVAEEDAHGDKDFNVSDLDKCTVHILYVLGALRLRGLKSCRVICGPVRGPIYVEACTNCVVVASGRQLRIHGTEHVDFYVHVASGPVIEDCRGVRFAPSGLQYAAHDAQLQEAGLSDVPNAWKDVKDFKWHRAQKSPNWEVIPENEREDDCLNASTIPRITSPG